MLKEYLTNIANAIRTKLGIADKINARDFAGKVNEVYDKGQYIQAYQFFTRNFKSPYHIPYGITHLSNNVFCYCWGSGLEVVIPDTVNSMSNSVFSDCYKLEKVNVPPNLTTFGVNMFYNCEKLKTIVFNNVKEFMVMKAAMTSGCVALKNIVIENGVIAQDWQFTASPLSVESMKSIILHLKNFAGTDYEYAYTIRFTDACWSALESDGTTAPDGTSWKDYVYSLGWNI